MKKFDLLKSNLLRAKRPKEKCRALDNQVIASHETVSVKKIEGAKQSDQCSNTGKIASKCLIVDRVSNFMSRNDANNPQLSAHSSSSTVCRSPHSAFTLAELLIVIGVLGIVANLALVPLITDATEYAYQQATSLALMKIGEATKQMKTNDVLAGYATSDAFADEFAKYMKFGRRCTSANLANCFVSKFKLADNTEIDATTLTTGAALGHATYTSNTVGLGLVNGTNMILAFDPACVRIDPYNNTTDTTSCLALIYDINGAGKPNKVGKDIALLNVTLSTCTGKTFGGLCVAPNDVSFSPIHEGPWGGNSNSWAGARDACLSQGQGMRLPTSTELDVIYQHRAELTGLQGSAYWSITEDPGCNISGYICAAYWEDMYWGTRSSAGNKSGSASNARCVK